MLCVGPVQEQNKGWDTKLRVPGRFGAVAALQAAGPGRVGLKEPTGT